MIKSMFFLLILILFTSCVKDKKISPSGKVVKIGVLAPLSGDDKRFGKQSLFGIKSANEHKQYLNNGDEIVFEIIDTKTNYIYAKKALESLKNKNIKAVLSFEGSDSMISLSKKLKNFKIPMLVSIATNNEITKLNSYITQVCMSNDSEAIVASHYLKDEKLIHNVGVLYDSTNRYSTQLSKGFIEYFEKLTGTIVFEIDISSNGGLDEFKNVDKKNVEMIFNALDARLSYDILKILKKQNDSIEILGTDGLFSDILEYYKDDVSFFDGISVIEHYTNEEDVSEKAEKLKQYLNKYNLKESSFAFLAYDSYELLYYALNTCEDYKPECINTMLQNSDVIEGIHGNFNIIDAKSKREIYVNKIQNEKLVKEIVTY